MSGFTEFNVDSNYKQYFPMLNKLYIIKPMTDWRRQELN